MASVEYVVYPEGELDLATVPALRDQWLRAIDHEQPGRFVVDLRAVTYLDSTALSAVVSVRKRQREHGGDAIVTNASPRLAKLFELTGLDGVLEVNGRGGHADVDDPLDARWNGRLDDLGSIGQ